MIIILIITVIIIILLTRLVWRSCSLGPAFVEYSFRAGSFRQLISCFASSKFHFLDKGYPDALRYQFCSLFNIEAVDFHPPPFQRNCVLFVVFSIQYIISYFFPRKKFKGIVFYLQYSGYSISFHTFFQQKVQKNCILVTVFSIPVFHIINIFSTKKFKGIVFCLQRSVSSILFHTFFPGKSSKELCSAYSIQYPVNHFINIFPGRSGKESPRSQRSLPRSTNPLQTNNSKAPPSSRLTMKIHMVGHITINKLSLSSFFIGPKYDHCLFSESVTPFFRLD